MPLSIKAGGLLVKDPNSIEVYVVDWGTEHLAASATISTSTWTITGPDAILTKDQESIQAGNRKTQLRLSAGTVAKKYTVLNRIVTGETPAQTKDASFTVLVKDK